MQKITSNMYFIESTRKQMSLYKYLKRGGVNVTIKEFALFHNTTNQTLRNYYKEDKAIIDAYIKEWRERK